MLYAGVNYLTCAQERKMKAEGISVWRCFIAQETLNMFKSRVILLTVSEPAKLWLWVRIGSSHPRVKVNPSPIGTHPFFFLRLSPPLALCFGEGEWPWKCEELSKHTQKLSPRNSEIIYVWSLVVNCNVKWQKTLMRYLNMVV
jgi:hypothetical protein